MVTFGKQCKELLQVLIANIISHRYRKRLLFYSTFQFSCKLSSGTVIKYNQWWNKKVKMQF